MSYTFPTRELAQAAADKWSEERKGMRPLVDARNSGRSVTRYIVGKYANPEGAQYDFDGNGRYDWGVVERWTYDERPDLGEMGGGFVFHVDA
jgi:hypothetical protein